MGKLRAALTLTELLVTIAIIAIVLAVLLSAISRQREGPGRLCVRVAKRQEGCGRGQKVRCGAGCIGTISCQSGPLQTARE